MTGLGYQTPEHVFALNESCRGIDFGAVKLIQLQEITNVDSWNKAIIYELHKYIHTDFAFLIHSDGYIKNPEQWQEQFISHDYIGAPWPLPTDTYSYRSESGNLVRVGNSVSIRSKKLMERVAKFEWKYYYGNCNEDGFIACHHRDELEKEGYTFAPLEVAKYFSKEHEIPENKDIIPFAFHSTI